MLITEEGGCSIGEMPVAPRDDEALHDSVLNYLYRLAMATGHPVRATVHDARGGFITPIEVQTDGSSQFAGEPERMPERPLSASGVAASARSSVAVGDATSRSTAQASPGAPQTEQTSLEKDGQRSVHPQDQQTFPPPAPDTRMTPPPSVSSAAARPAPASPGLEHPVPVEEIQQPVTPQQQPTTEGPPPLDRTPPAVAEAVSRINHAIQMGHIEFAATTAQQSLAVVSQQLGTEHPHVLELRELSAQVAYLAGDMARSMATTLEVARARYQRRDPRAYETLMRAAAVWPRIGDPRVGLECGRELVDLWSALVRVGGQAAEEVEKLDAAKQRMVRLTQRA
ncbi:hypothetical protein AN216_20065 [Streptomyces oceani]|uniref:Tetratricopeptide repeat protein n=1 Tax=Streptomyces oceani TaxID=1075402 RepID=A0A1E7JY14_9ACTN|nr:hypothetical protein AN216_20065 [Streptomyces oceani]